MAPAPRRRKRWYRRWLVRVPLAVLAVLIGVTALGAATGPPVPVKAAIVKTDGAPACLSLADAGGCAVITAAAITAATAATQVIRYADEPTLTVRVPVPVRVPVAGPGRRRRRARGGQPSRAVTAVLVALTVILLAAVIAAGSLA